MPAKTTFRVVHVSGQDEKFKAVELNIHSPTTKGWQSGRFCLYPQDIVIQLEKKVRLKKIQLLSHQYLIATKIEFYVGDVPDGHTPSLQNARYTRLGYVALSDNANSNYKARELKSVHVDAVGVFVKFVIHKNHINKHNLYNQVGIVALNVIGDELSDRPDYPEIEDDKAPVDQALAGLVNDTQNISPLDDLAFDMYQDPEVAQIIRKLEKKKQEAALQERYDYAKRLKTAIQELQKVGEKLGKFEVEKRQAVESEDYDKAKLKKINMDEYRLQVYKELHVHDLLEMTGSRHPQVIDLEPVRKATPPQLTELPASSPLPGHHTPSPRVHEEHPLPTIKREQDQPRSSSRLTSFKLPEIVNVHEEKQSMLSKSGSKDWTRFPPINSHKQPDEESETPLPPHTPYEERPLPASKNKGVDQVVVDQPEEEPSGTVTGEAEEMSDKDQRNAATAIDEFELPLVTKVYSKVWSNREDGLLELYQLLQELPVSTDKDVAKNKFRAATFLIDRALRDKVFAVFTTAFRVLRMMLTDYATKHKLHKSDLSYGIEKTLPILIQKTGDTAVRTRETATKFILEESKFPEVMPLHIVVHECVKPFKLTIAPRLALSRTEVVAALYQEHGLGNSGLTVENIMKFCTQAIRHTAGEVRERAEKIIVALYKNVGQPVKEFLPPDDEKVRRNMLYKQLFEAFDRIDGKPSKDELKRMKQQSEAAKQKEIQALQDQLNHLKDMTSGKVPVDDGMLKGDGDGVKGKDKKDKKNKTKSNKPTTGADPPTDEEIMGQIDHTCIFCNESNDKFTEEGLDLHYWKSCPMLKRCSNCKQVVEISGLTDHLLSECDSKGNFQKCPRCTEAVLMADFQQHIADRKHPAADPSKSHCPLCHLNILIGEEGWKQHLMGRDGCKQNPRRLEALNKQSKVGTGRGGGGRGPKMTPKPGPSKATPRRT